LEKRGRGKETEGGKEKEGCWVAWWLGGWKNEKKGC
jgi:hypothetical protein